MILRSETYTYKKQRGKTNLGDQQHVKHVFDASIYFSVNLFWQILTFSAASTKAYLLLPHPVQNVQEQLGRPQQNKITAIFKCTVVDCLSIE